MGKANRNPWTIIRDLPCLQCGYNLRSLTGPGVRCPECGHTNDLAQPDQWVPKDFKGHQYKFGNLLVLTWGTWIGLAWLTLTINSASYTNWKVWPTTLIAMTLFVASTFSLIRNGRKEASRGMRWSRLSICFVIASFTVAGPFLGIALGIVTDSVLSWYWLAYVGGGFLLSLAGLKSLSIILPGEIARIRLPAWNRYCDAVKQQAKARLKPRSR